MKIDFKTKIDQIKSVGPKKYKILEENNLSSIQDLLYYYPKKYVDKTVSEVPILSNGINLTTIVQIIDFYTVHGRKTRLIVGSKTKNNQRINLVFFKGISYFKNLLKPNTTFLVSGKIDIFNGYQMIHPQCESLSDDSSPIHAGRIIPMYASNEDLSQNGFDSRGFRRLFKQIFENELYITDFLPQFLVEKYNFIDRKTAFEQIHFPSSDEELKQAIFRLKYEEIFIFFLAILRKRSKKQLQLKVAKPKKVSNMAKKLLSNLPFELTDDQKNALKKIEELSLKDESMSALLQGDVGSGKTLVAILTALRYIENGLQVCFICPTEILAKQHFYNILNFLNNAPFLKVELLLGGEKKKLRAEKLIHLKKGDIGLIIGTHSMFQDDIEFQSLGLVIIDEQHKFGVEQREKLIRKGTNPDVLAMTATPIPRTLALSLYGDLDQIVIKNKPKGRQEIKTLWLSESKRRGVYKSVRNYLKEGRQCYVVYPLVEESEKMDLDSCIESYEIWKEVFSEYKVDLLHGKMKSQEKNEKMHNFKLNKIQILITTTVVEVGIDVSNATIMIIENAERFGISQLHQLRGRVGRGSHKSFCVLMSKDNISEDGKKRLEALESSNDGFYLAEKDMEIRGPGEMLGIRQSGLPNFKLADLQYDKELIESCREDVFEVKLDDKNFELELSVYRDLHLN